ncbi:MAG: PLP-dependent transferase [Actinomycetaceae bacterium]|nr:PLP-dependent transferase [Actinomycetaceae bacterium]
MSANATAANLGPDYRQHPEWGFDTRQIHAGVQPDPVTGAQVLPIFQTNAYQFSSAEQGANRFALKELGPIYTRLNNPTNEAVENKIANLEGGVGALLTASGQGAITTTILTLARAGSNIVASPSIYGGTYNLLNSTLSQYGIETRFVSDPADPQTWKDVADENTVAFYGELIPNPAGDILDIEPLAAAAHQVGVPFIVDATVATPYLCRPFDFGADIVVHSATKYLGGHGAAISGVIVDAGRFDYADPQHAARFPGFNEPDESYHGLVYARDLGVGGALGANLAFILKARVQIQRDLGFAASPFNSFLVNLGLETLSLRVGRHVDSALRVAEFLEGKIAEGGDVVAVAYPGLPSSPYYGLAQKYTPRGAGAVLTFDLRGGLEAGLTFASSLQLHSTVANIGDVRSLVAHPASTTHSQMNEEQLRAAGITAGTVRLSVGLEDIEDILADVQRGLDAVAALRNTQR